MTFIRVFFFFLILNSTFAAPASYLAYTQQITNVSLLVFEGKEQEALQKFDSLFDAYPYIFASHTYLGLQLAGKLKNEPLGYKYLRRAFLTGVPAYLVRRDSLISGLKTLNPRQWNRTMAQYDSLHQIYLNTLHTPLKHSVDSLYEIDQALTDRLNQSVILRPVYWIRWNRQNKRHVAFLANLIRHSGYPGEKQTGITTLDFTDSLHCRYGVNCFISNHKTLFMFIHYFSRKRNDLNALLLPEVASGNMSAYEYAVINDFLAEWSKGAYRHYYHNEWHQGAPEDQAQINENRKRLGLCSLQQREAFRTYWKDISKNRLEYKTIYLPILL